MGECNGVTTDDGPFQLGSDVWPGLGKLAEEAGEVVQVIGKIIATGGRDEYWEDRDLRRDLENELGDLRATILWVMRNNKLNNERIVARTAHKVGLFTQWAIAKAG